MSGNTTAALLLRSSPFNMGERYKTEGFTVEAQRVSVSEFEELA
jgi:hypothetical protein